MSVTVSLDATDVARVEQHLQDYAKVLDGQGWENSAHIARAYAYRFRISRLTAEQAAHAPVPVEPCVVCGEEGSDRDGRDIRFRPDGDLVHSACDPPVSHLAFADEDRTERLDQSAAELRNESEREAVI